MRNRDVEAGFFADIVVSALTATLLFAACCSCGALKRSGLVGGGAAVGAGAGLALGGPAGAVGGAAVGAGLTNAVVEADASGERADAYAQAGRPNVPVPPRATPSFLGIAWWWWLLGAYFVYLRRAHLLDMLTGKAPRFDAALRAVGWHTHKSPRRR